MKSVFRLCGFGFMLVLFSAAGGIATADNGSNKQKEHDALNEIENVQSIKLDLTIQGQIDNAVDKVTEAG